MHQDSFWGMLIFAIVVIAILSVIVFLTSRKPDKKIGPRTAQEDYDYFRYSIKWLDPLGGMLNTIQSNNAKIKGKKK